MKTEFKSSVLNKSISQWVKRVPLCERIAQTLMPLFDFVDEVNCVRHINDQQLEDFVSGMLIVMPLASKREEYENKVRNLTDPVFKIIRDILKNDRGLREIMIKGSNDYWIHQINLPEVDEYDYKFTYEGFEKYANDKKIKLTEDNIEFYTMIFLQDVITSKR